MRQGNQAPTTPSLTLVVNLRDSSGTPLDAPGIVNLRGGAGNGYRVATTQDASAAVFPGVAQGEYDAEAKSVGYVTTTEHISIAAMGASVQVYIYLPRESEVKPEAGKPGGTMMSPKLQGEIDKGIEALRRHEFETARAHFAKGAQMAPGNADVAYLLGVAEVGLHRDDIAAEDFRHAVSLNPGHQRALLALGELQLNTGDSAEAIATLEKAFQINGADWRVHFLLASAYSKGGRFSEAETHAERAASLAQEKGAESYLLLGEIQRAEGKRQEARQSWQKLLAAFPKDPAAEKARVYLAEISTPSRAMADLELASLPLHALPNLELAPPSEQPWAPADVDGVEFPLAADPPCRLEELLTQAERRVRGELQNFEKFSAKEHIEHQEVDRYGRPGPPRARDFSYIVIVHGYRGDSFFLEEERMAPGRDDSFPTSLATSGLNNLGVAVLQPAERKDLFFRCEGLAHIRGLAAWQIHFEEKKGAENSIRDWRRNGQIYGVPVKGRVWVSAASYDLVRVETDLREPVAALGLTRDHLTVEYGPVRFRSVDTNLWLPWSAEMFMELRGHRYHHRHSLSDYTLFEVDANHRIGKPKESVPPESAAPSESQ
jgi:Flp pilus assembly protein TadD